MSSEGVAKRAKTMPAGQRNEKVIIYKMGIVVPKDVTKLVCDPSVIEIGEWACWDCTNLKEVVLNEGLIKIDREAFRGCSSLTSIRLPSTVTEIGENAFYGCDNLKEVVLNEGLQIIGESAFDGCESLTSIMLPSTVTEVGKKAFMDCNNLKEVELNEGLQIIGVGTFYCCTSLRSIEIPSTVTEIGYNAFRYCRNLTEIILHEGLQKIGLEAFSGCLSLEHVKFPSMSKRVQNLVKAGQSEIQEKIDNIQRLELNGDVLLVSSEAISEGSWCADWVATKGRLDRALTWISYYELKDATSTIELAMWKAKIDTKVGEMGAVTNEERNSCRVDIPGPAKEAILQFFK